MRCSRNGDRCCIAARRSPPATAARSSSRPDRRPRSRTCSGSPRPRMDPRAGRRMREIARVPLGAVGALLVACVLNSDIEYQTNGGGKLELVGSSTERALVEAAQRAGFDPRELRERWPRARLVERREGVHYVISEHADGLAFVKGAP